MSATKYQKLQVLQTPISVKTESIVKDPGPTKVLYYERDRLHATMITKNARYGKLVSVSEANVCLSSKRHCVTSGIQC